MRSILGQFMDGVSAAVQEVTLLLDYSRDDLVVCSVPEGDELARWTLSDITVDSQHGGERYHIHPGAHHGAMLTSSSGGLLAALVANGCSHKTVAGNTKPAAYILTLSAAIALLVSGIYLSLPTISRGLAEVIPMEYERILGVNIESLLQWTYCESDAAADVLTRYADLLGPERAGEWEVHITSGSVPNAFALPGGVIVFSAGAIHTSESLEEVLGVLAHEIEHVERRHVLSSVLRSTILTSLWSLTIGDYAGLMVIDPNTAHNLANLKFSRDLEREADSGAITRLLANHLPVEGLGSFLERIGHDDGEVSEWFSTHPSTTTRVQAIADAASRFQPESAPQNDSLKEASLTADWEAVRASCKEDPSSKTNEAGTP